MDLQTSTLGEIACSLAGATQVFRRNKLDFCCNGNRSIEAAVAGTDVDADTLREELSQLSKPADETNPAKLNNDALIDYLLINFHEKHRRDLPELIKLANKVEHVHADKPMCPIGLTQHLVFILQELESHMQKEEQVLFPAIQQHMHAFINNPIHVMEEEHQEHGRNLEKLSELLFDFEVPAHACNTWRALILGVKIFTEDITEHIHLENNVLFPSALRETASAS